MKVKVAGVGTAALLALGLAGCGSGGGDEYGSAQELWDSLSPVASCPSDGLNIEEMPAEGDLAAHSRVDCYPTTTDSGVEIEVYGLVVEDGEQLESVADYYGVPLMLTGPNWGLFAEPEDGASSEDIDDWMEQAQQEIGGELQES